MSRPDELVGKLVDLWRAGGPGAVRRALTRRRRRATLETLDPDEEYRRWLARHERRLYAPMTRAAPSALVLIVARERDGDALARTRGSLGEAGEFEVRGVSPAETLPDASSRALTVVVAAGDAASRARPTRGARFADGVATRMRIASAATAGLAGRD